MKKLGFKKVSSTTLIGIFSVLCIPFYLVAETGPLGFGRAELLEAMTTDRPSFSTSTNIIQTGHFQIESGYTFSYNRDGQAKSERHNLPETALRFGLTNNLEFRIYSDGYVNQNIKTNNSSSQNDSGLDKLTVGFKTRLFDREGLIPHISFAFESDLPSASSGIANDEYVPRGKVILSYDFCDCFVVSSNLNLAAPVENSQRYLESSASLMASYALTNDLRVFGEAYGIYPESGYGLQEKEIADAGFTYQLTDRIQLDIRYGVGLSSYAPDYYTGAGIAFRV